MAAREQFGRIGIYMRLSRDDGAGESVSIEHQRMILHRFVDEHGGEIVQEYVDDGWSGTSFERPSVARMLDDAKLGKLDTIIVKDLSRFGRNYIQVGQYIDYIFPAYGIRFIALADNVDTADRGSAAMDMMPIMNVFNEWHAANTSKKIRAVLETSQRAGKYTNWTYPYGYTVGGDALRTAVVDESAATVVRRIFDLRRSGMSARAIARILTDDGIPSPAAHYAARVGTSVSSRSRHWSPKTVMWILTNPTYLGKTVQHKTTSVSYKNHKVVVIPESDRIVRENAHEPIVERDVWDSVQALNRSVSRGRVDKNGVKHALSGLVVCPDCGKKFKYKSAVGGRGSFVCRTYVDLGKKYCTSHAISERLLECVVLQDLKSLSAGVEFDAETRRLQYLREAEKRVEQCRRTAAKRLGSLQARRAELDKLIRSVFEDKVLNGLPEDVAAGLVGQYSAERETVEKNIAEAETAVAAACDSLAACEYVEKVERYIRCESLTREMCMQLIEFVTVGERSDNGAREIHIYYKFAPPSGVLPQ